MQKWIFNNNLNITADALYSGRFYSNEEVFIGIVVRTASQSTPAGLANMWYRYNPSLTYPIYFYDEIYRQDYYWRLNSSRTIIFDEANVTSDFLTFVQNNATQVPVYNGIQYEDIHINDETLRNQYITLFDNQNYDGAFSLLNNTQILNRYLSATKLNDLTNKIVELENNDDDFDKFFAYTQATQPSTISSGQMWWQIET